MTGTHPAGQAADFFISYTSTDRAWAEWIAWQLEADGYEVIVHAWDFGPGSDWLHARQQVTATAARVVAVLSPAYLESAYEEPEWLGFLARDLSGEQGLLLPVRVAECDLPALLSTRIFVDLVGLGAEGARAALLAAARDTRAKPAHEPEFPGGASPARPAQAGEAPPFPGDKPDERRGDESETTESLIDEIDILLDEVDDVLEPNAEAFVESYVQLPGNGGGYYYEALDELINIVGRRQAPRVVNFLENLGERLPPEEYVDAVGLRFGRPGAAPLERLLVDLHGDISELLQVAQAMGLEWTGPDEAWTDEEQWAARHELSARDLLLRRDYETARQRLTEAMDLDPSRADHLRREFGFLLAGATGAPSPSRGERQRHELDWFTEVWSLFAANNDLRLAGEDARDIETIQWRDEFEGGLDEDSAVAPPDDRTVGQQRRAQAADTGQRGEPQAIGQLLEEATLSIFKSLFTIPSETQTLILQRLRRQTSGTQFGHDLEFDCTTATEVEVRCHVECKNFSGPIKLDDIAGKLVQQEFYWGKTRLDHWILISPHTGPSNELSMMLQSWREQGRYPFSVQIWSPENQVEELFGLQPTVYERLYGSKALPGGPPTSWSESRRRELIAKWTQRVTPHVRLSPPWRDYLRSPERLELRTADERHFERLYRHHLPLRAVDSKGINLPGSLEDVARHWLAAEGQPSLVLLGDFGQGKTFFTYVLARQLAEEFLKDPGSGWFPLRLSLRDLRQVHGEPRTGGRELLERRLQEFGADLASWREITRRYRTLVVLDGFDEISVELDPQTVTTNIRKLVSCYEELKESKVLITSRSRVFQDAWDQERLLERIGRPQTVYIAPIPRRSTVRHLHEFAKQVGAKKQVARLHKLYDPIGLAAKPLFLQMIKETLERLPENLSKTSLYDTYIDSSLKRKLEDLEDEHLQTNPQELVDNLLVILELVAVKLHRSGKEYVYLRDLETIRGQPDLAQILWRMSETPSARDQEDATARVGVRSLLTAVPVSDTSRWPVDFFHRSMREFFVARAIVRALGARDSSAQELLASLPLQPEITWFAVELMRRQNPMVFESELLSLARSAVLRSRWASTALGGNAITLLYGVARALPADTDWKRLNLDNADLNGADLSGLTFAHSSLRYANLDNANLERADFRHADLTGVRIEETAQVDAVAPAAGADNILAAYEDGTVREWKLQSGTTPTCNTLFTGMDIRAEHIHQLESGEIVVIGDRFLVSYAVTDDGWQERTRFRIRTELRSPIVRDDAIVTLHEQPDERVLMRIVDLNESDKPVRINIEAGGYGHCDQIGREYFAIPEGSAGVTIARRSHVGRAAPHLLEFPDINAVAMSSRVAQQQTLVATGHRDGYIRVWAAAGDTQNLQIREIWEHRCHDGIVTSVTFLGDDRIVSGGSDRTVCVATFDREQDPELPDDRDRDLQRLRLTLRCKGMKITGLRGEREHALLRQRLQQDDSR